ncbi:ROK family protein [Daejeonella lutea]|uniref:Sugar kinase of the NBD/HSP70 family, may contain an N-terminal HTH domain n=1 Tax=Daejeonella lutea TaxID=572036 RepID=A0A1T5CVN1_9SPHI|nr:ROK family transcriptional regulator [Daejeonella lutea]SKB63555.1 Sugar kinase of the NBD/HSP70 family, may contain an N-terminal HTH domain [Daejeonella lutea]
MSVKVENTQRLRADIIKYLYYKKTLSLADLSKLTQRSVPLVTATVNSLIADKYVTKQGLAPSTGGRRPLMFLLNPDKQKFIVAVAMDQRITRLVIFNLANEVVLQLQLLNLNIKDDDQAVDGLLSFINSSIESSGLDRGSLIGVGIGMPGLVNAEKGINNSYFPTPDGSHLGDYLSAELALPVYIDNDSSLITLAELHFGEAVGMQDALVVNVGWGTGLGVIIKGGLYRGSTGYAGEFSHIPLSKTDNLCSCGKKGCLEVDTSLWVMVEKAKEALAQGAGSSMHKLFQDESKHPGEHFLDAVIQQDPLAVSILAEGCFQLGKGLSTLIHILNPECIVLSGRGARAGKMLLPAIQQAINEFCIPRIADQTSIVLSNLADNAELLAAASLVVENSQFDEVLTGNFSFQSN